MKDLSQIFLSAVTFEKKSEQYLGMNKCSKVPKSFFEIHVVASIFGKQCSQFCQTQRSLKEKLRN